MKYLALIALFLSSVSVLANPKVVIGKDTRVKITEEKSKRLHNSIGLLILTSANKTGGCTGTIVGPRSVITAAHCLYDSETGKIITSAAFFPGLREKYPLMVAPHGVFHSSKIRINSKYKNSDLASNDFGLISFDENLPFDGLSLRIPMFLDRKIIIAGYPGDKTKGELWEGRGEISKVFMIRLFGAHNVDTYSGQSGASIRSDIEGGDDAIIGIHSGGFEHFLNTAFFFDKESLAMVKKWIQEDK